MQRGPEKLSSEQSTGSKRGPSAGSGQPQVISAGGSRRQGAMALSFLLAAGLISAPLFAASAPSAPAEVTDVSAPSVDPGDHAVDVTPPPVKLESPDGDCFEWKYPKKTECGALSGKTECKAEPSINTLEKDEAKRAACKPEEGAECFCGEDDDDDDDDDDE